MKHLTRCPTCHRRHKRSNPQNALYWVLVHRVASIVKPEGAEYAPETWHKYFKSRFLGCEDTKLPNGRVLTEPLSSADLDVNEFSEFYAQVEAWAAERGVWLEDLAA